MLIREKKLWVDSQRHGGPVERPSAVPCTKPRITGKPLIVNCFQTKMTSLKLIMSDFFFVWEGHGRRHNYSVSVFGTITCFFKELSGPIFDFFILTIFRWYFVWKVPYETKTTLWTKNIMEKQVIFCRFREKNRVFFLKIENRLRQFSKETCKSARNTNEIVVSSTVSFSNEKKV